MKHFQLSIALIVFFLPMIAFSQASNYFSNSLDFKWTYDVVYTGEGDTVIPGSEHVEIDSIVSYGELDGKQAYTIQSRLENGLPNGSMDFAFEGANAFVYTPSLPPPLDTIISIPPPYWAIAFKFGTVGPIPWVIFEWDTTVTIDSISVPAAFRIECSRVTLNENVTVPAGNFTAARFNVIEQIGTRISGFFVPLFSLVDTIWIAPDLWIIKHTREATTISFDTLSLVLPGIRKELAVPSKPNSVSSQPALPAATILHQNYPNPFNPTTTFSFVIGSASGGSFVSLKVFDALGREITTLVNGIQEPGYTMRSWDASEFPGGTYYYQLTTRDGVQIKKLLLVK